MKAIDTLILENQYFVFNRGGWTFVEVFADWNWRHGTFDTHATLGSPVYGIQATMDFILEDEPDALVNELTYGADIVDAMRYQI